MVENRDRQFRLLQLAGRGVTMDGKVYFCGNLKISIDSERNLNIVGIYLNKPEVVVKCLGSTEEFGIDIRNLSDDIIRSVIGETNTSLLDKDPGWL